METVAIVNFWTHDLFCHVSCKNGHLGDYSNCDLTKQVSKIAVGVQVRALAHTERAFKPKTDLPRVCPDFECVSDAKALCSDSETPTNDFTAVESYHHVQMILHRSAVEVVPDASSLQNNSVFLMKPSASASPPHQHSGLTEINERAGIYF